MTKIRLSHNNDNISDADLDLAFMRLQRLLEKKVRVYWHKAFFSKYSDNQVVPWGLRIQIFPNVRKVNDALKTSWEGNLQSCSLEIIYILCNQYEKELETLDSQISNWYQDYILIQTSPRFSQQEKDLKVRLEEYTLTIINNMEAKFQRDKMAHENGYAYR